MGINKARPMKWRQDQAPPPCIKAEQGSPSQGMVPKNKLMYQEQVLVPLLGAPQKTKLHNCHSDADGLGRSQAGSLAVCPESMSSHKLMPAVSAGFPIMIFTPLAHTIPPSSLFKWTPGARPSAWLWISASASIGYWMMTPRAVSDLITGKGQFGLLLHSC